MGRYTIHLSSRADDMTQEIILPVTFPDYSLKGVPHGEIRMTATLTRPAGGVSIEIDVRDEDRVMVHRVRYAFQPHELIPHAWTRQLPCAACVQLTKRRNGR